MSSADMHMKLQPRVYASIHSAFIVRLQENKIMELLHKNCHIDQKQMLSTKGLPEG